MFFSSKNIQKYFIVNLNQISTISLNNRKVVTFEYHKLVKNFRYNIESDTFKSSFLKE